MKLNYNPEKYGFFGGAHLMGTKEYTNRKIDECIDMLKLLKESAQEIKQIGKVNIDSTLVEDVKLSSFNFVLNEAILLLMKYQEANT